MAGNYNPTVESFQHGLKIQPDSIEGLSGLAQTYVGMGHADEAKKVLLQVLAANPRRTNDLQVAGELFLQSGDQQRALNLLGRAEALSPSSRTELLMAIAYQRSNQPDRAEQMLQKARDRNPHNPEVLRAVANYYREVSQYDKAIAALQEIPNPDSETLGELGYSYELAGKSAQAASAYAKAAEKAPQQLSLQLAAAGASATIGEFKQASRFLDRAAAIEPSNYRVHAIRGDILRHTGNKADAIQE